MNQSGFMSSLVNRVRIASPLARGVASLTLAACGETRFSEVAVVEATDQADRDSPRRDADIEIANGLDAAVDDSDCVTLQQNLRGAGSDDAIEVVTANSLACNFADAGGGANPLLPDNIFRRRDGELMIEAFQKYSFRWPVPPVVTHVRIYGGDRMCPTVPVLDAHFDLLTAALYTCTEFTPKIQSKQILLFGSDYLFTAQSLGSSDALNLKLCRGSCPPNTQAPLKATDAGVDATADAASQVPKVP